jgi:hypothetical protein
VPVEDAGDARTTREKSLRGEESSGQCLLPLLRGGGKLKGPPGEAIPSPPPAGEPGAVSSDSTLPRVFPRARSRACATARRVFLVPVGDEEPPPVGGFLR